MSQPTSLYAIDNEIIVPGGYSFSKYRDEARVIVCREIFGGNKKNQLEKGSILIRGKQCWKNVEKGASIL